MLDSLIRRGQNGSNGRDKVGLGSIRRPVIGLALGGGAARGLAHIGIVRTLVAHGIVPKRGRYLDRGRGLAPTPRAISIRSKNGADCSREILAISISVSTARAVGGDSLPRNWRTPSARP